MSSSGSLPEAHALRTPSDALTNELISRDTHELLLLSFLAMSVCDSPASLSAISSLAIS